jgi:hypothetical protein
VVTTEAANKTTVVTTGTDQPNLKAETREQWANWLSGLARWDWFGTFTFSDPISSAGAHYWFDRYLRSVEDAINGWSLPDPKRSNGWGYADMQATLPRIYVKAFRADEYGPRRGRLHMHALIAGVGELKRFCGQSLPPGQWGRKCCFVHAWPCGYARVLDYDPNLGAGYYISKYTVKAFGDWALYGFSGESGENHHGN